MPNIVSAQDVVGKTLYPKVRISYWKGSQLKSGDLDEKDRAGTLPIGYPFKVWSYAAPSSVRKNLYWLMKDENGKILVVKMAKNVFDFKKLAQQGVKTEEQKQKEQAESELTLVDRIERQFGKAGKFLKTILIVGLGIYAVGYLAPKFRK